MAATPAITMVADDVLRDATTLKGAANSAWPTCKRIRGEVRGLKASIKRLEAALRHEEGQQKAAADKAKADALAAVHAPPVVAVVMPKVQVGDRYIADGLVAMAAGMARAG